MNPRLHWHIHQLAFLLEKRADEALRARIGLGFAQFKVLEAVGSNIHSKQNLIAELLNQTEASVSRQVKLLERRGLLIIGTVMDNRRARELSLTERGEEALRLCSEALQESQSGIMNGVTQEEQAYLHVIVQKVLKNLP